jgi:Papain-like cysteine protease AvrRpt2
MELPLVFADAVPINTGAIVLVDAELPGGDWTTLDRCTTVVQEKTNWCWVSACQAIDSFYRSSYLTQCAIATEFIGAAKCVDKCSGCNDPGELQLLLEHRNLFEPPIELQITFERIKQEITKPQQSPICCHLSRANGHFLIIFGFADDPPRVAVRDPAFDGPDWQEFDDFCYEYKHSGVWDQTYFTTNG